MLSMYSDAVHVYRALQAGATGYIIKRSVAKEVVDAIRAVHRGGRYLSKQLADVVIDHVVQQTGPDDPLERPSSRERQVLKLLAEGLETKEIAGALGLSVKTVFSHRLRIQEKLQIHSVAGLTKYALRAGMTTLNDDRSSS